MKITLQYLIIVLLFWSCGTQNKTTKTSADDSTKLIVSYNQTSGLNQDSPEYSIELYSNRQMYLTAIKNLDRDGKFMRTLNEKEFNNVITSFIDAKFFKFDSEYTADTIGLATRHIYFSHEGKEKTIKDYSGAPDRLTELEYLMQSFLDRVGWEKMTW